MLRLSRCVASLRRVPRPGDGANAAAIGQILTSPADVALDRVAVDFKGTGGLAANRGLATMVWTVNDDTALAQWVSNPDVDVLVTDRPRQAIGLRGLSD
jgi:hypothetical protein